MRRTLTDADVDAIARRVAELLGPHGAGGAGDSSALTVKEVAERLGVNPSFVYANARELGGYKLSDSPRARWRFDATRLPAVDNVRPQEAKRARRRRRPRDARPSDPTFGGLFGPRERG